MEIALVTLVGGLLALDATSVGQFMLSRPLVAGVLVGWLLGEPALGIAVGSILELYLLVSFPTGGSRFPEGATATVVAVASAAGVGSAGAVPIGIAVGLVWGQLAGFSITALRHLNGRLVPEPEESLGESTSARVVAGNLAAIAIDFARGAVVTVTGVVVGRVVLASTAGSWSLESPDSLGLLLVGGAASAGILLRDLGGFRRRKVWFAAGLALGILGARLL